MTRKLARTAMNPCWTVDEDAAWAEDCRLLLLIEPSAGSWNMGADAEFIASDERIGSLAVLVSARFVDSAVQLGARRHGVWQVRFRVPSFQFHLWRMDRCFWPQTPLTGVSGIVRTSTDGEADAMRRDLAMLALLAGPA